MAEDATDRADPEGLGDAAAWRLASDAGRLGDFAPGTVLRAFREARAAGDERLAGELVLHLSDEVVRRLRRKVDRSLPDGGRELLEAVHFKIMEAIVDPASADGEAMIDNFDARLHFRFIDAVKPHRRRLQVELPPLVDAGGEQEDGEDPASLTASGAIDVVHALSLIRDERKRLAFALTMANHPKGEIAATLKVDLKTLYLWLREVREFLKTELDL